MTMKYRERKTSTENPTGSTGVELDRPRRTPHDDVAAKQDPRHTRGDFERDLDKATDRTR